MFLKAVFNRLSYSFIFCIFLFFNSFLLNFLKANNLNSNVIIDNSQDLNAKYRSYLVSAGDVLNINFVGIKEFSGDYFVGPDGTIYLPELRGVYVQDMTIDEIYLLLNKKYSRVLNNPNLFISIKKYRPVQIFIKGEVKRPGLYTILGTVDGQLNIRESLNQYNYDNNISVDKINEIMPQSVATFSKDNFPTLYSAIKLSNGITPYSDLSKVRVVRKDTLSNGGGYIYADVNLLSFITEGDLDKNIRVFDGDVIEIPRSEKLLTDQLIEATNSNLNPANLLVYVGGNVEKPGETIVPQGSSLNHAIASSGGRKDLSGKIEFFRLSKDGDLQRRVFNYSKTSKMGEYENPILVNGDIIKVNNSNFKKFTNVFGEITAPFLGVYSVFKIFGN